MGKSLTRQVEKRMVEAIGKENVLFIEYILPEMRTLETIHKPNESRIRFFSKNDLLLKKVFICKKAHRGSL